MSVDAHLVDTEYLRDYIEHLKYARERLLQTYGEIKKHSEYITNEVWRDSVCERFMEMLEVNQKELIRITDAFEDNCKVMSELLVHAERLTQQKITI